MSAVADAHAHRMSRTARVTRYALGPYQTAVVRMGIAGTFLSILLREWPNRRELYGPDGTFEHSLAERRVDLNGAFTALLWSDGVLWFELLYLLAILASLAMLLGWRTRAAAVLFMLGVLSVQNRNAFVGDGGTNLIHLMAIYLVATRCSQVWSLDARRARRSAGGDRTGPALWGLLGAVLVAVSLLGHLGVVWVVILWSLWLAQGVWWCVNRFASVEPRTVLDMLANLLHNSALLVIIVQMCLLYSAAGWYKIQGTRWQDGTAVYYPLQVEAFNPWPLLSDLVSSHAVLVLALTYGTVFIQVAFPFTLFNRRVKNAALIVLIAEHIGIAVMLGLPFFSLAVIAGDLVFAPTAALRWAERKLRGFWRRERRVAAEVPERPREPAEVMAP
ncbi:Vitamin K-dependent gamma-carboxylase [Haloechinothrix alba]|uniref:Vitamin K-dependent gamma-carboxylase n=1 Tax=Haloechinothrix alba TaxID=664784 RepID=A0A238VGF3_9PSEU|nr:HTTM domain-containing protein [Haloechinothrix alba]SNR33248.1 Vitamin K-dependent gamma-carboxylase [Haloechinothrix alba]